MGARTYWSAPLSPLTTTDGPAVTAAALTDASPVPQKNIPGNLLELGTTIRMHAQGEYSSSSAAATLTLGFYWGTVGSITTATAIAVTSPLVIGTATAWPWLLDWEGEVRALGPTGQVRGMGTCTFANTTTGLTSDMPNFPFPITAAGRIVTVSTVAFPQNLMIGCTWSSTSGTPSLTCHHVTMELLG
jgi:hypothetical protein